jgi:hypothetical protein
MFLGAIYGFSGADISQGRWVNKRGAGKGFPFVTSGILNPMLF